MDSNLDNRKATMQGRHFLNFTRSFCGVATRYVNFYAILYVIKLLNDNNCVEIFKDLFESFFVSKDILRERDFKMIKLS